jgi:hypothetical protein
MGIPYKKSPGQWGWLITQLTTDKHVVNGLFHGGVVMGYEQYNQQCFCAGLLGEAAGPNAVNEALSAHGRECQSFRISETVAAAEAG